MPRIYADTSAGFTSLQRTLALRVLLALDTAYPWYSPHWSVGVNESGFLIVRNLALSGTWGFVLPMWSIDEDMRAVVRAGGELLERYRMSRSAPLDPDDLRERDRGPRGELIPEVD